MNEASTESEILEAAKFLFVQRGYSGTTMQAIADRAEINKALLHYYFRSKDRLFRMVLQKSIQAVAPRFDEALSTEAPVLEKLQIFIRTYIEQIRMNPHIPIFLIHEISQNRLEFMEDMKEMLKFAPKVLGLVAQLMAEQQAGTIKDFDPRHVLLNVLSMCAFPFVARPVFCNLLQIPDEDFEQLIDDRAEQISAFVLSALTP